MNELLVWTAIVGLVLALRSLLARVAALEGVRSVAPPAPPLPQKPEVELASPPKPTFDETMAPEPPRSNVDWEAVLGGNLLNKLGVLLLIVGIALFLGYSLRELGPGGRVALGALAGFILLSAGMFAERRKEYELFGRGLAGGGWAGLYFTTFASYAVPAAQIVSSPVLATLLLAAVSAAMIAHSLRYRSETVTGMAYLLSFVALGVSGVSWLALVATVPVAASLIFVAYRFHWMRLIMGGLPAAYVVFILQSQSLRLISPDLAKLMLLTYWIVFEAAEVLRPSGSRLPFLLNAICFSFLAWGSPALAASVYAASFAMRIACKREYRGAATAFAVLCASAIFEHTDALMTACCLLLEAQLIFLAGVRYKERYVRWLGAGVFVVAIGHLMNCGATSHTREWALVTTGVALLMYANRYLHRPSFGYSFAGTALTALVLATETKTDWLGVAWLALAGALAFVYDRTQSEEWDWQSTAMAVLSGIVLGAINVAGLDRPVPLPWQPQLAASLLFFAGALRSRHAAHAATAGTILAAVLAWNVLPAPMVAVAWAAIALALFESRFRRQGEALALAAFGRLFFANFDAPHRLLTAGPVIALQYYLYARGRRWFVYTGVIAAATLIRFEAGHLYTVLGWGAMFVLGQYLGALRDNKDLRYQSYLLAALTFAHCWAIHFHEPASAMRAYVGSAVVACLFAAHLISRRDRETFGRPLFSNLGSALLSVLLFLEVSGKVLTMAWAVQGAVLLTCGFPLRERHVRLTGLALLAGCTAKLFFYDFANLDTPHRIASFFVLGALLIGGSWFYTRFRKQREGVL